MEMNQNLKSYVTCIFLKQELLHYKSLYTTLPIGYFDFYTRLNAHLIALNIFKDFADKSGVYLQRNTELLNLRKSLTPKLEFIKYLRHRICGHLDEPFVELAIKWHPQLLMDTSKIEDVSKRKSICC